MCPVGNGVYGKMPKGLVAFRQKSLAIPHELSNRIKVCLVQSSNASLGISILRIHVVTEAISNGVAEDEYKRWCSTGRIEIVRVEYHDDTGYSCKWYTLKLLSLSLCSSSFCSFPKE